MRGRVSSAQLLCAQLTVVGFWILAGCNNANSAPAPIQTAAVHTIDRPDCPHDPADPTGGVRTGAKKGRPKLEAVSFKLPKPFNAVGRILDIPEFHDCQRFIVKNEAGALKYTNLHGIYAIDGLDKNVVEAATAQKPKLAAVIYSFSKPDGDVLEGKNYDPLNLTPGYNCLYLTWTGKAWQAFITNEGDDDKSDCAKTYVRGEMRSLQVKQFVPGMQAEQSPPSGQPSREQPQRASRPALGPDDIPAVARWDWDETNSLQYITIKCGHHWCDIGQEGFAPAPEVLPIPGKIRDQAERKAYLVKGYYDRQLLAVADPTDPTGLRPSNAMAVVVPVLYENAPTLEVFRDSGGIVVARVYISNNEYQTKLGFHQADLGDNNDNEVSIKYNTDDDPGAQHSQWTGKFTQAQVGTFRNVTRRGPYEYFKPNAAAKGSIKTPRTARWRWRADDEYIWVECVTYCCQVCNSPSGCM